MIDFKLKCKYYIVEVDGLCTHLNAGCNKLKVLNLDNVVCLDGEIRYGWVTNITKRKELNSLSYIGDYVLK